MKSIYLFLSIGRDGVKRELTCHQNSSSVGDVCKIYEEIDLNFISLFIEVHEHPSCPPQLHDCV